MNREWGGDTETSVRKDDHDITLNIAIKEASSQFINEINRSIDYFLNRYSTYNIEKIIISGDTFKNFDLLIKKETGFEVEQFNVGNYFNLDVLNKKTYYLNKDLNHFANQLTLAIGMALRGYGL
ncbi:MAG: hypothetical protein K9H14_05545 [Actinomycetia bacterium]|nr:hypothetical protein [Actinomycetes bacterium]